MGLLRWLHAKALALARRCVLAVLAAGPLPAHVAFVMDGNRRYARARGRAVGDGHAAGFRALERVLEACLRLDVRCVSVYAFSLENFARPEREVQTLMDLAEAKLRALARRGALLHKYGARLNVCGRVELLPERVQRAVREAEELTKHNTHAVLNLCMPYTSRDEITTAVQTTVRDAVDRGLDPATISDADIAAHLMTAPAPPPDILVRTSGVARLSDFLLWQCSAHTQLQFARACWPEFGLRDLVPVLLDFQRRAWAAGAHSSKAKGTRVLDCEAEGLLSAELDDF